MAMGTLTRKIHLQSNFSVMKPPITGPSAGAIRVGTITTVDALALSAGGKERKSIAIPTGASMPPPTPCTTRKAMSWPMVWAMPHNSEPMVKAPRANMKTRLVPKRSPSQPLVGIHTARLSV